MHYAVKYLMFASSLSLFACGPEGSQPLAAVDDDGIAHASQAVTPTQNDRPAAAIVARVVNGQTELWVFACGADHRMRRRVQRANGTWGSWIVVASSFRCFSAPSIGKWIGGTPSETIGVYYRGTNTTDGPGNRLIEAWYASDGSASATDLSAHTGFVIAWHVAAHGRGRQTPERRSLHVRPLSRSVARSPGHVPSKRSDCRRNER
jgi:hypothetical protein